MSLEVDGIWKSGVWDTTVWADGVWREGAYVSAKYVEITLVSKKGITQASLTALSWAWFDTSDIGSAVAPADKGTTEMTDGSGIINVELPNTGLSVGQSGILVLQSDDGLNFGTYLLTVQE